jgi:hypothetical protein
VSVKYVFNQLKIRFCSTGRPRASRTKRLDRARSRSWPVSVSCIAGLPSCIARLQPQNDSNCSFVRVLMEYMIQFNRQDATQSWRDRSAPQSRKMRCIDVLGKNASNLSPYLQLIHRHRSPLKLSSAASFWLPSLNIAKSHIASESPIDSSWSIHRTWARRRRSCTHTGGWQSGTSVPSGPVPHHRAGPSA